ncbi:hypothetical protein RS130_00435 [Paraglaciecola aquimarina]|uniref:Cohesin domain-containing protein n=1 Tax=Paraglaciecola aquimarina TaxID=1235557 RepID=A0ABU3SRE4_9ALTE|nr:hypothetical protein [Paraglaciecola aquimarina]MDU0352579.1 hypothetical protein [Paraglaciecola aquimarina]
MKKLLVALACFVGFSAQAGMIDVELSDTNPGIGDTVQVSILGSGFDAFDTLTVDLEFDTHLFAIDNLNTFGEIDPTTVSSDLAVAGLTSTGGFLALSAQTFGVALTFLDFDLFAGGDFTIASFSLTAITNGVSDFELANIIASDFFLGPVSAEASDTTVRAKVSAPTTLSLFVITGLALLGFRRKAQL